MSALQKNVLKKSLPPIPPGAFLPSRSLDGHRHGAKRSKRDYSPLPWSDFFDRAEDVRSGGNCFRVYLRGSSGPVVFLLHGGGHSALSWAMFAVAVTKLVDCQVVAMDIRGHGHTTTEDDGDLSADTLVSDVGAVADVVCGRDSPSPVVIVGHSMGGAVAVRVAAKGVVPSLVGLAVIDVVEGTAVASLTSMQGFLRGRPKSFRSLEHAVEWSIRSGQLRNIQSARVSMSGQVRRVESSVTADGSIPQQMASQDTSVAGTASAISGSRPPLPSSNVAAETITEEEGEEQRQSKQGEVGQITEVEQRVTKTDRAQEGQTSQEPKTKEDLSEYTWRIDLINTECYWKEWFDGLSALFLSIPVPKMLILAGVDRLDRELTIGQMQGKFQMQVLSGCGHAVHEDVPDKVAAIIAGYFLRHKLAQPKAGFQRPFPAC